MLTFTEALGEALYYSLAFDLIVLVPSALVILVLWSRPVARLGVLLGLWAIYSALSGYVGTRILLEWDQYPAVYLLVSLHPFLVVAWLFSRLRRRRTHGVTGTG